MKKIFKKSNIFSFLLGALIFTGITSVAAYSIFATDIGYTPSDSTWKKSNGEDITNVKDAIDELYTKSNEDIVSKLDLSTDFEYSMGYRTGPKTISIEIDKGSYFIVFASNYSWISGAKTPTLTGNIEEKMSNSNCQSIIQKKAANYITNGNIAAFTGLAVYKCDAKQKETVSFSHNQGSATGTAENFLLYSIKIN